MRTSIIYLLLLSFSCISYAVEELEEVVVTAHPLSEGGLAQAITVLTGDELAQKVQGSLGETLANEVGVTSANFGAAVGRPVIHGLGGTRVKTTEDRIDSLDVSVISGDHAVTIEPFIADQITILKGANTLLYGPSAIGGVVDVETGRIPKQLPDKTTGKLELRGSDNANTSNAVARLDGKINNNFAWHVDAFSRDADNYEIPGYSESAAFRASEEMHDDEHDEDGHDEDEHEDEHADEDHDEHEGEEERDILSGSELDTKGGAIGFSFVSDRGFAGFSVSKIDSNYGLIGHSHEHGHEDEDEHHDDEHHEEEEHEDEHADEEHHDEEEEGTGMIDMEQTRIDFEAQINDPLAGLESINFRFGINDYEHAEIEGNGEIGTLFENDAWEARIEAKHTPIAGFTGSFGLQLGDRDYSALGEEAFVQPVTTDNIGVFWVGEHKFDGFDIEAGLRFDQLEHQPSEASLANLDFNTTSASIGIVAPTSDKLTLSALADFSSRGPTIEELFSNGPHLATQSFEIGDTSLQEESVAAFSFSANYQTDLVRLSATLYHMQFDDFIYQANTGEEIEELPVFVYQQHDAEFTGLDAKADIHLAQIANGDLDMVLLFDTVSAEFSDTNDNLPRIPADRFGLSLEWQNEFWDTKIAYLYVSEQNDIAEFELPTDSYDDVSVYVSRSFLVGENELSLFLNGRNLTDEEQRNHVSFVKDLAPAPGRRFEFGLRFNF